MQLACIPLYIKFLGMESYGLVGFHIMILSLMPVLDMGLGPTMNRGMARYSVSPDKSKETGDFARTLEIVYWSLGISIGVAIIAAAPLIADRWINADALPRGVIVRSVTLIGGIASLQLPFFFYQGGLMGLQRQVVFNCVKIIMAILGSAGAVLFLWLVSPTITAFLAWQFVVAVLQITVLRVFLWRYIPCKEERPRFSSKLLRNMRHFTAGMGGITICSAILCHMDKILLSKMLPLKMFGYYSIAVTAGGSILLLVLPVYEASFPRFSAMAAGNDKEGIRNLYRRGNQLVAALVMPVAAVLLLFPEEALFAWTGNPEAAVTAAPIIRFLAAGFAVNGLMIIPYALQIAHGWTRLTLITFMCLIFTMMPMIYIATSAYGAAGAASVWLLLNLIAMAVIIPLVHRRLLPDDSPLLFLKDLLMPLAASGFVAVITRVIVSGAPESRSLTILGLAGLYFLILALTAAAAPALRSMLADQWEQLRSASKV